MNELRYEIFKFKGIIKDIEPIELMNGAAPTPGVPTPNVWTHGQNIHFDNESTHRVGGYAGFADPLPAGAEPIFGLNVLTPTASYWLWIDGQTPAVPKVYVTDGVNHFDISPTTPLTGGIAGQWSGCVLNGVPVLNGQIDAPFWWDGNTGNPVTTLPDWPVDQRCKAIRAYKYHLVALNLTRASVEYPAQYAWSSAADPGTIPQEWTPSASNDAGDNTLSIGNGGIVDALPLRDDFIIYKSHSCAIMSYIGGSLVFSTRELFNTSGIQALNCVTELRGNHWVFTDDDIIRHDGNTFASIADYKIRKFVLNGINPDTQLLAQVAPNIPTDEIWFCFPAVDQTSLTTALVYSFTDDAWGVRALPEIAYCTPGIVPDQNLDPTWDGATTTWSTDPRYWSQSSYSSTNDNLLLFSPGENKIYNVDAANDNDGTPIEAFIERTAWTVGGESQIWDNVLTRSIYPIITGSPGDVVKIQVAGTSFAQEDINWSPTQDYVIGDSVKVDSMVHGRYLNMRFSSSGGSPWQLHRIGIEYIPESKF